MSKSLFQHVQKMSSLARDIVVNNPTLSQKTGKVNAKGDETIAMDAMIEDALIKYIQENNIPANIFSEEVGEVTFYKKPKYLISFDPLDGSTNYKIGKNIYPYGLLIAVYDGAKPKVRDVVVSAAIEFSRDESWFFHGGKTFDQDQKPVVLITDWELSKRTPVFLDLYYKEGYEMYRPLAEKVFVRNIGSTIGNLSYTLNNIASGLGGVCMRPEEIGAIYSLIKGAGGVAIDHSGHDVGEKEFSPNATYQILAGSPKVVKYAIDLMNN